MVEKGRQVPLSAGMREPAPGRMKALAPAGGLGYLAAGTPNATSGSDSLLSALYRSRWIVLLCVVLSLLAGFVRIETATPIYTSTAKLYLNHGGIQISPAYEAGRPPQGDKYLHTQAQLLKSRPILSRALESIDHARMETFANTSIPVAHLHKKIVVEVGLKNEIISVSLDSPNPVEAAQIVTQVVDTYTTSRAQHEQRNSTQVLEMLQTSMDSTMAELEAKWDALEDYRTNRMPLSLGSEQGGGVMEDYLGLRARYREAQIARMQAEALCQSVEALADDPEALRQYLQTRQSADALSTGGTAAEPLRERLAELDSQKRRMLETVTVEHPIAVSLMRDIERLQARLQTRDEEFVEDIVAAVRQQFEEVKHNQEQLALLYEQQEDRVLALNKELAQYQRLRSEVDRLNVYAETLDGEIRELTKVVGEDVGQFRMEVLEPALRAERPSSPQKGKTMAIALVLGLMVGSGAALARDWFDQTLRSADDISATLNLPVLGMVPAMSRRQKVSVRGQKVLLQPDSHEAEAFRTIRTAVFFKAPQEMARTILVTSPCAGDGKSTLTSNLAIAMAKAGQKTLVLDADFRRPTQHAVFGIDHSTHCLSNVLAGQIKLREAIQPTQVENLSVLTCGHGISNPAEFLGSPRFAKLLELLAGAYARVIVDAPPVTVVSDAQILGATCDFTILTLKADKSTRRVALRAVDALQGVGARLMGIVVNAVPRSGDTYGYYGGYYRSYGAAGRDGGNNRGGERPARTCDQPSVARA